jgi:hypothetical protein
MCSTIHQHVAAYQIFAHPEHDYHTNSYIKLRQSGEAVGYISEKVITPGLPKPTLVLFGTGVSEIFLVKK